MDNEDHVHTLSEILELCPEDPNPDVSSTSRAFTGSLGELFSEGIHEGDQNSSHNEDQVRGKNQAALASTSRPKDPTQVWSISELVGGWLSGSSNSRCHSAADIPTGNTGGGENQALTASGENSHTRNFKEPFSEGVREVDQNTSHNEDQVRRKNQAALASTSRPNDHTRVRSISEFVGGCLSGSSNSRCHFAEDIPPTGDTGGGPSAETQALTSDGDDSLKSSIEALAGKRTTKEVAN